MLFKKESQHGKEGLYTTGAADAPRVGRDHATFGKIIRDMEESQNQRSGPRKIAPVAQKVC